MLITDVCFAGGCSGFFFDDQRAIKSGRQQDGFAYVGEPVTHGFSRVRQVGESISIMLLLEDGQIAMGDCAAVQYSGTAGREPLFLSDSYLPFLEKHIAPLLKGRPITSFREMAAFFDSLEIEGHKLHTALRYGLSQALLQAVALSRHLLGCEVLAEEYHLPLVPEPFAIVGQTGDERYNNADKMILKQTEVLPHALINAVEGKLGAHGETLYEYLRWLRERILALRPDPSYMPCLQIDCYGTVGIIFRNDPSRMADYFAQLEELVSPFSLYIEGPLEMGSFQEQIDSLLALRQELERRHINVRTVADEWCNTLEDVKAFTDARCCHMIQIKAPDLGSLHNTCEAILYCREHGLEAYLGGSCNETDLSTRACVQVAMGLRPDRFLAKPGMGFDEGFMIVHNEMERTIALLKQKARRQ